MAWRQSELRTCLLVLGIVSAFMIAALPLHAQEKFLPVFHFNKITTADGLPSNDVAGIIRDKHGLIWMGTHNGLARYDGYSFRVYRQDPQDSTSLPFEVIKALHYDKYGRFWIGLWGCGLSLYDPLHDHFVNFRPLESDSTRSQSTSIETIREDKCGNIWLGTTGDGVVRVEIPPEYQNESTSIDSVARYIRFQTVRGKRTERNFVTDITVFGNSSILVASLRGIYCINPLKEPKTAAFESRIVRTILDTAVIHTLFWQDSTKLWIGTRFEGLLLLDLEKDDISVFHKRPYVKGRTRDDPIFDIQMDQDGRLWVGTDAGLDLFDPTHKMYVDFLKYNVAPKASSVSMNLSLDKSGTLWIGTSEEGVFYLTRKSTRFPHYGLRGDDGTPKETETVRQLNDGSLWISSRGSVMKVDLGTLEVKETVDLFKGEKSKYQRKGVIDSYKDGKGNLWYGSFGLGLFKFEPASGRVTNYRANARDLDQTYISNWCRTPSSKNGDTIYVGACGDGVLKFATKSGQFRTLYWGYAECVVQDNEGLVWFADTRKYVYVYNPATGATKRFTHVAGDSNSLAPGVPLQTYIDLRGRIWITIGDVIDLWDPGTSSFRHFRNDAARHAPVSIITGSDIKGNLWIYFGTPSLSILDPSTGTFRNYTTASGLGIQSAAELLTDGRVMIATWSGINLVVPESLSAMLPPPPVAITRMSINDTLNIPISRLQSAVPLKLTYEQNTVEIEFAAIELGSTGSIEYKYRLEGLETQWIISTDRRFVRYTGLNSGDYILKVNANSILNEWLPQEISLTIIIAPPWWRTWWAYSIYGLMVAGFLFGVYSVRLKQVRLKQQVEMEHFQTEHLAEVDRLKSRFFSNISHEFRTPLTLILGPAEQLLQSDEVKAAHEKVHLIKQSAAKLLALVNQLLDFSRLESGVMKLQVSKSEVVSFLRRVVMSFESWAERKRITLSFVSNVESYDGYFDADKIEKIVNNLVSNALKFTPEGGTVEVKLAIGDCGLAIEIKDSGVGIPKEHLSQIFDRFYRVDETHATEGTGIGLALVKELIQLHHGEIRAESTPRKGSCFTVILPVGQSSYAADEVVESSARSEQLLYNDEPKRPDQSASIDPTQPANGNPLLLIVEDNADLRAYIRENLDPNYSVSEASDGKQGFDIATRDLPDLIISDVMMPEMDGIELCRMLKQDLRTSHIPIILLTARAGVESKIEGLETGADDYVTKPFDSRELLARVRNLIEQRQLLRKKFSASAVLKPGEVAVTSLDDKLLKKVMETVEQHMGEEAFSVDDLAREACLSRSHLNRKIHALTNLSLVEFIRYVRLQRAYQLLEQRAGSIADIAYQVGFGSPAYFSSCFHERFGYSPSELLRPHQS